MHQGQQEEARAISLPIAMASRSCRELLAEEKAMRLKDDLIRQLGFPSFDENDLKECDCFVKL